MTKNYFPDDEEIWEELLYFLKNPITKEEELARKKTESEYIDSVLEKAFSDSPQSNNVSKDTYLSYEDLLSPQEVLDYRQKQKGVDLLNKQSFAGQLVQQNNLQPSNLVSQNNNELQGFGNRQTEKTVFPVLKMINDNSTMKNQITLNNSEYLYSNTPNLYGSVEKKDLTLLEKGFDKILQNQNLLKNIFPIAADMYTDARTDFSRARANKNATILNNMNNLDSKTIEALKKYGVPPNERGVYYNENSNVSKKFAKSKELQRVFDENLEDIKKGRFKGADLNFDARPIDIFLDKDKADRYFSIQHAKMPKAYIDAQGRKKAEVLDRVDFEKRPDDNLKDMIKNYPNNYGYSLQEKGALENYFAIMDILIEDEKKNIFNKLMERFYN